MHVATPRGSKYFILFTNDFSSYRTVYFLKQKSEVADFFQEYVNLVRTKTGQSIHTLRADNVGELTGHSKSDFPPMESDWRHQYHTLRDRTVYQREPTGP